jgi:hypothetical protein
MDNLIRICYHFKTVIKYEISNSYLNNNTGKIGW